MRNLSSGPCFGYKVYGIGFVLFPQITKHLLQRSFFLLTSYFFAGEKMGIYAGYLKKDGKLVPCATTLRRTEATKNKFTVLLKGIRILHALSAFHALHVRF